MAGLGILDFTALGLRSIGFSGFKMFRIEDL